MRRLLYFALLWPGLLAAALPDELVLEYSFNYGDLPVGKVTKTLRRDKEGVYHHTTWTRPTGVARALTRAEWFEDGRFILNGQALQPLNFSDARKGDRKAYQRSVTFDWTGLRLLFNSGEQRPLLPGSQDQSSILYYFMLQPLTHNPGERDVPVTDTKSLKTYKFVYAGKEILETEFGKYETVVIRRLSEEQSAVERRCRGLTEAEAHNTKECSRRIDDFTVWLLPEKNYVAVKMRRRKDEQNLLLVLKSIRGL